MGSELESIDTTRDFGGIQVTSATEFATDFPAVGGWGTLGSGGVAPDGRGLHDRATPSRSSLRRSGSSRTTRYRLEMGFLGSASCTDRRKRVL